MIAAMPSSPILPATGGDKPAEPVAGSIEASFAALIARVAAPPGQGDAAAKVAVPDDDIQTDADTSALPDPGQPIDPLVGLSACAALIAASQPAPAVAVPRAAPSVQNGTAAPLASAPPIAPSDQGARTAASPVPPTDDQTPPPDPLSADDIGAAMAALKAAVSTAATDPGTKPDGTAEPVAIVQPAGAQPQAQPNPPELAAQAIARSAPADPPHARLSRSRSRADMAPAITEARNERVLDLPAAPNPAATPPAGTPASSTAAGSASAPMADTLVQHRLDLAHDGAWLDRLALDIAQSAASDRQMRFQLNPEHLGALHVELSRGGDGTSIRLSAETDAARTILADAQPRLIAEARAQGLRIAETHVDLAGRGSDGQRQTPVPPPALVRTVRAATADLEPAASPRGRQERYA